MKNLYFESIVMIERLHRLFLEVIKAELDKDRVVNINNVQALILYNIGLNELTVGELTQMGYYLGSNVSYNLRKMVQNGYVIQTPSIHDRRSSYIKLSDKGVTLFKKIDAVLLKQSRNVNEYLSGEHKIDELSEILKGLENYWTNLVK
jgi:DNA-binding MarR family transcriptional regulator